VYGFGPKVYGTFLNGRVEQFFPSCALTAAELRDRVTSRCIARRMRELHSVDLRLLGYEQGRETEPTVWRCLGEWASLAAKVLNTLGSKGGRWEMWVERFGLRKVKEEVEVYSEWVEHNADKGKGVVFARESQQFGQSSL
jgi:choline kinase